MIYMESYLILEGPSMRVIQFVAREVNACRSEDQLEELGEMYLIHYPSARVLESEGDEGRTQRPGTRGARKVHSS